MLYLLAFSSLVIISQSADFDCSQACDAGEPICCISTVTGQVQKYDTPCDAACDGNKGVLPVAVCGYCCVSADPICELSTQSCVTTTDAHNGNVVSQFGYCSAPSTQACVTPQCSSDSDCATSTYAGHCIFTPNTACGECQNPTQAADPCAGSCKDDSGCTDGSRSGKCEVDTNSVYNPQCKKCNYPNPTVNTCSNDVCTVDIDCDVVSKKGKCVEDPLDDNNCHKCTYPCPEHTCAPGAVCTNTAGDTGTCETDANSIYEPKCRKCSYPNPSTNACPNEECSIDTDCDNALKKGKCVIGDPLDDNRCKICTYPCPEVVCVTGADCSNNLGGTGTGACEVDANSIYEPKCKKCSYSTPDTCSNDLCSVDTDCDYDMSDGTTKKGKCMEDPLDDNRCNKCTYPCPEHNICLAGADCSNTAGVTGTCETDANSIYSPKCTQCVISGTNSDPCDKQCVSNADCTDGSSTAGGVSHGTCMVDENDDNKCKKCVFETEAGDACKDEPCKVDTDCRDALKEGGECVIDPLDDNRCRTCKYAEAGADPCEGQCQSGHVCTAKDFSGNAIHGSCAKDPSNANGCNKCFVESGACLCKVNNDPSIVSGCDAGMICQPMTNVAGTVSACGECVDDPQTSTDNICHSDWDCGAGNSCKMDACTTTILTSGEILTECTGACVAGTQYCTALDASDVKPSFGVTTGVIAGVETDPTQQDLVELCEFCLCEKEGERICANYENILSWTFDISRDDIEKKFNTECPFDKYSDLKGMDGQQCAFHNVRPKARDEIKNCYCEAFECVETATGKANQFGIMVVIGFVMVILSWM